MSALIVPIKTNNQRLPGKNTMNLGGMPLYMHLFNTIKKCNFIDKVYIDSSDQYILREADRFGFCAIKRPIRLNSADTSGNDLIQHSLEHVEDDIIGQFFVTTPFLKVETIKKSFDLLDDNKDKDCAFGLYPVYDRFWLNNEPVNHKYDNLVGTQYMNPLMREAGFYVFRRKAFIESKSRITNNYITFEVDPLECVDIDNKEDFLYASVVYDKILKGAQ